MFSGVAFAIDCAGSAAYAKKEYATATRLYLVSVGIHTAGGNFPSAMMSGSYAIYTTYKESCMLDAIPKSTVTIEHFRADLKAYIKKRKSQTSRISLFSYNLHEKTRAATLMQNALSDETVVFTLRDVGALREKNSELAGIVSHYKSVIPQTFLDQEMKLLVESVESNLQAMSVNW